MASKILLQLEVESATNTAVKHIVVFKGSFCKKCDAEEGAAMVEYLTMCKKRMCDELDKAIETFKKWGVNADD